MTIRAGRVKATTIRNIIIQKYNKQILTVIEVAQITRKNTLSTQDGAATELG